MAVVGTHGDGLALDVLNALSDAVLVIDADGSIRYANPSAEYFFSTSVHHLQGRGMDTLLYEDSVFFTLLEKLCAGESTSLAEHHLVLMGPRLKARDVFLHLSRLSEHTGFVAAVFGERTLAARIDRQVTRYNAGRSLYAMAAILAHEVKNPLSGVRGAAQLLGERAGGAADRELTDLIVTEADRIRALVERVEILAEVSPLAREEVNLHEVLGHVRRVAENGFARGFDLCEHYDPSLPSFLGHRAHMIQVFLNLLKNACEAVRTKHKEGGKIILETAYQHGVHLAAPGWPGGRPLPLRVGIRDNGPGIDADVRSRLFDPFVTGTTNGTGLGLAIVAKIVNDHGGVIECESHPGDTIFNVFLPTPDSSPHVAPQS